MSDLTHRASLFSTADINPVAEHVRRIFGMPNARYFPVALALEISMPKALDCFVFRAAGQAKMVDRHCLTIPEGHEIVLRENVDVVMIEY